MTATEEQLHALQADLPLTLETPVIDTDPGPDCTSRTLDYAMIEGLERTPGGRLWVAWIAGGDSELGFLLMARSDDDGATWSEPEAVIRRTRTPHGFYRRILVGNLWTDPAGRLWCFFDVGLTYFDGRSGVWAAVCDDPDADRPTWSTPQRIAHGSSLNKPIVLQDGAWLLPVSLWSRERMGAFAPTPLFRELDAERMAHWFVSTDAGQTWTRRGGLLVPERRFDEHMAVECANGDLVMLSRTTWGIARSRSADGGRTWSAAEPSGLPHVTSRFHFRRLASGRWLLVKHGGLDAPTASRTHLTAWLSEDEGANWFGGLLLDARGEISYPDGIQDPDGRIRIVYDHNRAADRELYLATFTEDAVAQGPDAPAGSVERVLVHKALG